MNMQPVLLVSSDVSLVLSQQTGAAQSGLAMGGVLFIGDYEGCRLKASSHAIIQGASNRK